MSENKEIYNVDEKCKFDDQVSTATAMSEIDDLLSKKRSSMKITSDARFFTAKRLRAFGSFFFFSTVYFSLALIFISLFKTFDFVPNIKKGVIDFLEIYLAMTVVVLSVVNAMARYELRSFRLDLCAENIRQLSDNLKIKMIISRSENKNIDEYAKLYKDINVKYNALLGTSESHTSNDYKWVKHQSYEGKGNSIVIEKIEDKLLMKNKKEKGFERVFLKNFSILNYLCIHKLDSFLYFILILSIFLVSSLLCGMVLYALGIEIGFFNFLIAHPID